MTTFDYRDIRAAFQEVATSATDTCDSELVAKGFYVFAVVCHEANKKWWVDLVTGKRVTRFTSQLLALMHSELSEGLEADRKRLKDDKLPHRIGLEVELVDFMIRAGDFAGGYDQAEPFSYAMAIIADNNPDIVKDLATQDVGSKLASIHYELSMAYHMHEHQNNFEFAIVHVARAVTKAIYVSRQLGFDPWGAFVEKMEFNAKREDHSLEHRKNDAQGKAY
jgi:hypothetical protein